MNKGLNGHIAMLSTQIICGLNVPVGKSLLAEWMTPIGLASSRVLFATLIFWTIGLVFRREKVNAKDLMVIALGGISGVACTYLSFAWGLNYTTPVHFALIVALNPIVVMLFSVLFLKEAINRRKLTGVLLGIAGACVLISQMDIAASVENHILGIVFAIVNTVMLGFYLIIIRRVAIKYSPVTLQKWMFLFAALSMLPFSINELYVQPLYQSAFCWQPLLQLVFVLLLATVLNNLLYPVALKGIQPTTASIYINLQPIIASVVAILIGQDIFSWDEPVSAILVISGVLLVSHSQNKK